MSAELQIIIKALDQASGPLKGVSGELDNMEGKASRLGSILKGGLILGASAAVAGIGALGVVLKQSFDAASEAEQVTAQLNAVLVSTGGVAGMTAEAINAHALALSELTRYEDEEIVSAQSLLLTFTKVGKDVFPDATEATLDMATAMKMDLRSATLLVGKALNDPIKGMTALTRSGIQFTQQQKDMIEALVAAGDTLGAQRIILAELETQFGGSAKAAGDTFAGQMDILKNSLGNVKEEIGGALLPVLRELVTWAAPRLVSGFKKFSDWAVGGIEDIRGFFGTLAEAKDIIAGIVDDINAGRGIRWAEVYKLADLFIQDRDMKVRLVEIAQDIERGIERIKDAFEIGGLEGALGEVGTMLSEAFAKIDWEKVKTDLVTYWDNMLQPALKTAITNLNEFTKADPQLFADVGAAIGEAINAGIAQYQETNKKGGQLGVIVAKMMGESTDGAAFWDAFGKSIQTGIVSPTLQNAVSGVMDGILAKVLEANPTLSNYLLTVQDIVKNIKYADESFGTFGEALSAGLTNPFQAIADAVNTLIDAIQRAINKWWELSGAMGGSVAFNGVTAGAAVTGPAPVTGIPGSGRAAAGAQSSGMNVTININAPGGNPRAVAQAAQTGVLAAARSMGIA